MFPALKVVITVFVLFNTPVVFPEENNAVLLYQNHSTVNVEFSASLTVALQDIVTVELGEEGIKAIATTWGLLFAMVTFDDV